MYSNTQEFKKDLIKTYEILLDIIKINGDSGIVNKKRQETYRRAIDYVKELDVKELDVDLSLESFIKELSCLTEKPKKLMKELFTNGEVVLENKSPYNGITIKKGNIVGEEETIMAFKNLSILTGIGIGLGNSGVKDLIKMGFTSIDQLKIIYEQNKFENFRKGLKIPLCKYFEGTVRIEKMSREEATKWKNIINEIVDISIDEIGSNADQNNFCKHKIAGSYARKQEQIGDIDYIIVVNGKNSNNILYNIMNSVLDKLTEVTVIGEDLKVELDSVTETPSKAIIGKRYTTAIKLWFKVGILKTKIEIYGYTDAEFCFPYFARSGEVNLQKKVKLLAIKKGYKLSPFGLFLKESDEEIDKTIVSEKIGKNKIESIRDLFNILEYSSGSN